jgi:hypothetical protein
MLTFIAFMLFGLYHIYITNPEAFNAIKMTAIFTLLQAQMFVEHVVTEGKKLWHNCDKYIQKNMVVREKIFSNEHILECNAIYYNLKEDIITKIPFKFCKSMIDDGTIIPNDGFIVTEIKFDTLETVRLTGGYKTQYSISNGWKMIEDGFASGYPTRVESPFMCVEVLYDGNRYDITGVLKEYLYAGNKILSSAFIRMFMFEHLGVNINKDAEFSLHTVDQAVNINDIHFDGHEEYVYEI